MQSSPYRAVEEPPHAPVCVPAPTDPSDGDVTPVFRQLIALAEAGHDGSTGVRADGGGTLLLAIEFDGARYLLTRVSRQPPPSPSVLSPREQEIVRMVSQGFTNKAIASVLEISTWTVSTHLRRIFAKMGVSTRAAMVARVAAAGGQIAVSDRRTEGTA